MARRKARIPQGKKLQPAPMSMTFFIDTPDNFTSTDNYLDLSQCASLINRRFYRQGINWAVSGFTVSASVTTSGGATNPRGSVNISKIPHTWVASNAWHKGFATWQKMNNEALQDAESVRPKFLDYKVFMDSNHHIAGVGANLIPMDADGTQYTTGTWDMSEMIIPNIASSAAPGAVSENEIIWTGANYPGNGASGKNAVSLIEGYAASRGLPDIRDPNAPTDAADVNSATPENWISATFNEGTSQIDEVLEDMITENNKAPYPFENDGTATDTQYPGGANQAPGLENHFILPISSTTIGGLSSAPGGSFYGGLIKIRTSGDLTPGSANGGVYLQVHLVPGSHRGYMCQAMQDV